MIDINSFNHKMSHFQNLIMNTLMSMESDIDRLYQDKQPNMNMYCFIHLDISNSLHKVSLQSIIFKDIEELKTKLLRFFDQNNTNFLIDSYMEEKYTESKYVLFTISNQGYIEFCSWIKSN